MGSVESPTFTRYDEVDGTLVEGPTVSFFNFGLTSVRGGFPVIVSDTKAYFAHGPTEQIIVWDPAAIRTARWYRS